MDAIGYGLLSRELIHRTTEEWHRGGAGVLYLRLADGTEAAGELLRNWTESEPAVYWYARMGGEYLFFLRRTDRPGKLEQLLQAAEQAIRRRWQEWRYAVGGEAELFFGSSLLSPSRSGRSAETMIYAAIKEAILSAEADGSERGEPSQAAAARDGSSTPPAGANEPSGLTLPPIETAANSVTIGELAAPIPVFDGETPVSTVARLFERDPKAQGIVIAEGRRPIGILMKEKLHQLLAGQFGLPLYWSRPVSRIMDDEPLIVDSELPIEHVSQMAMSREFDKLYDVVTITKKGELAGVATIRSILESITKLRTEAARGANPLTGLPGNDGIERELKRRIRAGRPFAVIYADLDYFKWFNDYFGFHKGDEMIRYTAEVLRQVLELAGDRHDFVGHIGGDDYIVITEAPDPETVCRHVVWRFDGGVKALYDGVSVNRVVDRSGNAVDREGVTISLSLMTWDGQTEATPELFSERAAQLKKQAKGQAGSCYVKASIGQPDKGRYRYDTKSNAHRT